MNGASQRVHLRFNDAAGQPTAVRLRVTDATGQYLAAFGRLTRFATEPGVDVGANVLLDDGPWAIIDGACEISLPPGPLKVQARKGPEFRPLDVDLVLHPGKMSFRFTMERWIDLAADGWRAGDTCCYEMSPHAALMEASAADLAVVDLLIREKRDSIVNIAAYSGQVPAVASKNSLLAGQSAKRTWDGSPDPSETAQQSRPTNSRSVNRVLVVVNTANQSPYGRLLLLNTHRAIYPLSFSAGEKWSLIDWCDQCHRKKGLVVADDWLLRLANGHVAELLDHDFLRRVDAIRFHPDVPLTPWFEAQRRGYKLPLVAGSGKESNRELLGSWRTYAKLPIGQPLDYAAWTEAIRRGETFVTNGPLLRWTTGERLTVEASHLTPLDRLQLLANGHVVADVAGPKESLRIEARFGEPIVARCEGPNGAFAMSSPISLAIGVGRA